VIMGNQGAEIGRGSSRRCLFAMDRAGARGAWPLVAEDADVVKLVDTLS